MQTNKPQPLVTVYVPTYNRVELLQRAVNSVLKQDYRNIELIVVDDNSTDSTHEYLAKMANEDLRFKYLINDKNSGACVSRNRAIFAANGEFITGLDDDDYFLPDRIDFFIRAALKDPNKAYYTKSRVKITTQKVINPGKQYKLKTRSIKKPSLLLKQNFIGNQIFTRTKLLQSSGGFDEKLGSWQDLECWFNLLKTQRIEAYRLNTPTQVVDLSHAHERISRKKINNMISSYKYITEKHNLNELQKFILHGQLLQYNSRQFNTIHKLALFLLTRQAFYLKSLI